MWDLPQGRGRSAGYLVAAAATVVAALARLGLSRLSGVQAPFFPFVLSVLVAAWYGGFGPGILATALGVIVGTSLAAGTEGQSVVVVYGGPLLPALYVTIGVSASWLSGTLHAARRRIEDDQRAIEQAEKRVRSIL